MGNRKKGWLKYMGILQLVMGAMNLVSGLMSFYALLSQGDKILAEIQKIQGVVVTMQEMTTSVLLVIIGGAVMFAAGLIAIMFTGIQGKQQLCIIMGYALLAYIVLSDVVNIAVLGGGFSFAMLTPFIIHGLYLFAAFRNKNALENNL